jgi:signal transduction histidine kinase
MDVFERNVRDAEERVCRMLAQELRTPLLGITSAAQLLRFRSHEDPVVERNVGRILRELERLNALAADLLEYGRTRPLALAPRDPDTVWDTVLDAHRGHLESRSLSLKRTRATPAGHCAVDVDELEELFATVLTQAVNAAPLCTELTLASMRLADGAWRCTLHDAGPPIPAAVLPHAFEILAGARPGDAKSSLAVCRRIAEAHGGTIAIESAPGEGTTVEITLPGSA